MSEKTSKFIHILYVLLITNIISIFYLVIGLFSFTLVPVIFANINITNMLMKNKIDGYSGILNIFNELMKDYFKKYKKEELATGIYSLLLLIAIWMLRHVRLPMAASVNYLLMYIYGMIIIYWCYYGLYIVAKEESISYINSLAVMFLKPKKLIVTIVAFGVIMIFGILRKELLAVICITLFSAIFVKVNRDTVLVVKL